MGEVIGRLKSSGDLLLMGEVDERLPVINDGLVAHFPFDGTEKGQDHDPIMDYSIWEDGQTGAIGSFGTYGGRNARVLGMDPWGKEIVVWQGVSLEGSTSGSGIYYSTSNPIDSTKLYRMTWWEKRVTNSTATYCRYYAGLHGYGSTNGVYNRSNGSLSTNPYFWNTSNLPSEAQLPLNTWVLVVGHVFPAGSGIGADHPDSGRYTVENGRIGDITRDWVWHTDTTTGRSRTLMIYTPNAGGVIHQTVYPRMDICDGTEPTIEDLLNGINGEGNVMNAIQVNNCSVHSKGLGIDIATTNLAPNVDYGNRDYLQEYNASSWGGDSAKIFYYPSGGYNNLPYKKMIKTAGGTGGSYIDDNVGITIEDNKTYIISCWIKASRNVSTNAHILNINRISDNTYRTGPSRSITTEWVRYYWTYTSGSGHAGSYRSRHIIYNNEDLPLEIYWSGFQVQELNYLTSFVKGSKTFSTFNLGGDFFNELRPNFGFSFKAKVNSNTRTVIYSHSQTSNANHLDADVPNNRLIFSSYDGTHSTININVASSFWGSEHHYVVNYYTGGGEIFIDGESKGTVNRTSSTRPSWTWGHNPGGTNRGSITIRNLSIYDRNLSLKEVQKLNGSSLSIKKSGNLIKSNINETVVENALKFESNYVSGPNIGDGVNFSQITFEAWLLWHEYNSATGVIQGGGNVTHWEATGSNSWRTRFSSLDITASIPLPKNEWFHLATTYNRDIGELRHYVNGELVHTGTGESGTNDLMTSNFNIGDSLVSSRPWDGLIRDVRVWNVARTEDEIKRDMYYISPKSGRLIGNWRFDEGTGNIAHDSSPNENHGTINGATWVQDNSMDFDIKIRDKKEELITKGVVQEKNNIVKDGLILNLDAGNKDSYFGSGNTWYDISGNDFHAVGYDGTGGGEDISNFPDWQDKHFGIFYLNGDKGLNIAGNMGNHSETTHDVWFYKDSTSGTYLADARNGTGSWWFWNYNSLNINVHTHLTINDPSDVYSSNSRFWYRWIHCVITSDNNGSACWINGVPILDDRLKSSSSINANLGENFRIGCRYTGSGRWTGWFASYKIYDRILTPEEIRQNYYALSGRFF